MMDKGPEWRAYTLEEKASRRRVGVPEDFTKSDKGLSTVIRVERDAFGKKLSLATRLQMWRLRKWQTRLRVNSAAERNLIRAFNELNRLSDKLTIPKKVRVKAAMLYRDALDKDIIRGRTILGMITAALYIACRLTKTSRSLREIAEKSFIPEKEIARYHRFLVRRLKIRIPIVDPVECISKIAEKARISGESQGVAVRIILQAKRKHLTDGKSRLGLAAAALYLACQQTKENKIQKEIADAADITEVTLRNRKKELEKELDLKIPNKKERSNQPRSIFLE